MTDDYDQSKPGLILGRREILRFGIAAAAAATVFDPGESEAVMRAPGRQLSFLNLHTGERVNAVYWDRGRYLRDGMRSISHLLRDHRTGAVRPVDPKLLDVLHRLSRMTGGRSPIHVISGYRSPETNASLRENDNDGVAQFSYHMQGKAMDIRIPGVQLRHLQRAALSLRAGGVGYYPESNFVHVDVGPLRRW